MALFLVNLQGVTPDMLYGVSKTEAQKFQDEGRDAELTDAIVAKFQALRSKGADFLLVVGTSSIPSLQAKGHMDLAEALGIETVGVHSLEDVDPKDVTHNVSSTLSGIDRPPPTIILNQIPEGTDMEGLAEALNKRKTSPLAMLPTSKVMSQVLPQSLYIDTWYRLWPYSVKPGDVICNRTHGDASDGHPTTLYRLLLHIHLLCCCCR